MPAQFFEHGEAEKWRVVDRMMQDVEANQAGVKIAIIGLSTYADSRTAIDFRSQAPS